MMDRITAAFWVLALVWYKVKIPKERMFYRRA